MCRREPRLEDLLSDPLIRLVMASDAVEAADIRRLARRIAPHVAAAQDRACAARLSS